MRARPMTREEAEELAIGALRFLASDPQRIGRFLTLSGLDPADLRKGAGEPALQQAILAHLLSDESLLLVFASEAGVAPERVGLAEQLLGGHQ